MHDAIDKLYASFAHCRMGDDFQGCDCCVDEAASQKLAASPLRELSFEDLDLYSRKAITTWGNVRHFKHFLPRLLELAIEHRDDFLNLEAFFDKLKYAQFESWPQRERDAVNRFFDEYWKYQLDIRIVGAFEDSIDTVLCALSNALPSVQRFLDIWTATRTDNAKRHLAAFILKNDRSLLKKGQLSNAFWDTTAQAHAEVVKWLQSEIVFRYFDAVDNSVLAESFSYARPQLMAIRAAMGAGQP